MEPSVFKGIDIYGKSSELTFTDEHRKCYYLSNETGEGRLTSYQVFSGIDVMFNDIHMSYCSQDQYTAKNVLEINHCKEGRFECSFGENSCCYIKEGDFAINPIMRKKSYNCFPLSHYEGITIVINFNELLPEICNLLGLVFVDLEKINNYICENNRCCIIRANKSIEHIFSELYLVREKRKIGYLRIKIIELLFFISDLEINQEVEEVEYFNQNQVQLIKKVEEFIKEDIAEHYTIEHLADKFKISPTALKKCFRGVYGSPIYSYLKSYRLQVSKRLLEVSSMSVTEIAMEIGYGNPNKFISAFKKSEGVSPARYRKGVRMDSKMSEWRGNEN